MSISDQIDAGDIARIDAHAEHAALEYSLEDENAPEHQWLEWDAENARCVVIPIATPFPAPAEVIAKGRVPRLRSIIEVRVWLEVDGSAYVQIHRSIDGDGDGDCEPYFRKAMPSPSPGRASLALTPSAWIRENRCSRAT